VSPGREIPLSRWNHGVWNSADSRLKVVESRQHCPFG
jgi:hypothetical protein